MNTLLRSLVIPGMALALTLSSVAADKPAPKEEAKPAAKDPKDMSADEAEEAGLCPVTKKQSKPVYHFEYKGKEYHFATRDAQKEFAANPEKFGAKGAAPAKK